MAHKDKDLPPPPPPTLESQFVHFSKWGDTKSDGQTICLSQSDKWLKQALVIGKKITLTDTGVLFNKFKTRNISFADFEKYLLDIAKTKAVDVNEIVSKLINCGLPGMQNQPTPAAKPPPLN